MSRANFVQCRLANPITAGATTLTVKVDLPAYNLPPTDGGLLVLMDATGRPSAIEIIQYTSRSGSAPTYTLNGVTRGVEGTTAQAWAVDAYAFQSLTAGELDSLIASREAAIGAGTTAQYWRGDKTWRDFFTDVRAATLTGLSTATNAVISATDTVLGALGKLQAQISGKPDATTSAADTTSGRVWRTNDLVKQTSASDATSGSVLLNGAHGLGARVLFTSAVDFNTRTTTAFTTDTSPVNGPTGSTTNTLTLYNPDGGGRTFQFGQTVNTNDLYIRGQSNGAWSNPWNKLWHDGNLIKQPTPSDATAGQMLLNGSHGIGIGQVATDVELNNYLVPAKYLTPASGLLNLPAGFPQTRHTLEVIGVAASNYVTQTLAVVGATAPTVPEIAVRCKKGANGWSSWGVLWHDGNLVKQTSQLDATAGRALVMGNSGVGPFGMGELGVSLSDVNDLTYSGLGRVGALSTPNAPTAGAGCGIGMPHAAGMTSLGGQLFLNYTTDAGNYLARPRLFMRSKSAAATFGSWAELATLDAPSFTGTVAMAGQLDMTAQIVYEANNYASGWARGLSYQDGGTTAAGIGGYGAAGGVVDTLYMGYGASPWVASNRFEVSASKVSTYGLTVVESGQLQTKGSAEGLRLYAPAASNAIFLTFYDNQATPARVGYVGKASSGNNDVYLVAEQGEVRIQRTGLAILTSNATGAVLNGYTKLGDTAPAIKQKKLTGTTPASENSTLTIAHGLTSTKIIGVQCIVHSASGSGILPGFTKTAEFQYDVGYDGTNVSIYLSATNSGSILSKAVTVLITYEE